MDTSLSTVGNPMQGLYYLQTLIHHYALDKVSPTRYQIPCYELITTAKNLKLIVIIKIFIKLFH